MAEWLACYIEIEFPRSNRMRSTTLVELHRLNELRSTLVKHVGSKFVIPFPIFPKFLEFDTIQSIYFRNFHWSTRGRTLVFDLGDSIRVRAPVVVHWKTFDSFRMTSYCCLPLFVSFFSRSLASDFES